MKFEEKLQEIAKENSLRVIYFERLKSISTKKDIFKHSLLVLCLSFLDQLDLENIKKKIIEMRKYNVRTSKSLTESYKIAKKICDVYQQLKDILEEKLELEKMSNQVDALYEKKIWTEKEEEIIEEYFKKEDKLDKKEKIALSEASLMLLHYKTISL